MAAGFNDEHPAGGSFFIPHTIKLKHNNPIWTPNIEDQIKRENYLMKKH